MAVRFSLSAVRNLLRPFGRFYHSGRLSRIAARIIADEESACISVVICVHQRIVAITKQKKTEIIAKLMKIFTESSSIVFVQFHKLTVANAQALRRKLREAGSGYYVAKKTLIRKSLEGGSVKGNLPVLEGEVAVAYVEAGNDVTAPAREVFGLTKQLEKAVRLIGGIFEGKFITGQETLALAAIPPRQTLLAQFVNLVQSPIQRFAVVLDSIAKKKS